MDRYRAFLSELVLHCESPRKNMSDQLELDSYDARFILEALQKMSDKWHHINRTSRRL